MLCGIIKSMKKLENNETRTTEMVTISRAEYESINAERESMKTRLDNLSRQADLLHEQLYLANKKLFGSSSEKIREELMDQLRLTFNEAEAYSAPQWWSIPGLNVLLNRKKYCRKVNLPRLWNTV